MWWDKPNKAPAKEAEPLPFMKIRWVGFIVTAIITVVTTWSLMTQGLNMGLDFTGGVQIEASRETPFEVDVVRAAVAAQGFTESSVTPTSDGTVVIRVPLEEDSTVEETAKKLETALGAGAKILKTDNVSGKVSGELFGKGVLGTGAFLTTLHDVYAVIGLFSITQMAFDLTIVAGVLTVAGYSINDTVVVYDRIREMLKKYRKLQITRVIDISITSTLSRTLITSLATMLAAASMAFLGGPVLFGFAVSIVFGIIIGTYSSIFVAAPLLIHLPGRIPGAKYRGEEDAAAERAASAT